MRSHVWNNEDLCVLFSWQGGGSPSGSRGLKVFWTQATESHEEKKTELEKICASHSFPVLPDLVTLVHV